MSKIAEIQIRLVDFVDVNLLVVIFYYSFAKCHHLEESGQRAYGVSLYYFLQLHVNLQYLNKNFYEN